SALGDFFLAFKSKWTLPLGIAAFLLAQLAYVLIFTAIWFFSGDNSPLTPRYIAMGAVIVTAIVFLVWMAPRLGWMALAVVPYALAITGMGVAAMWLPWAGWPAIVGALLFLSSDFVLAAELFRLPPDARQITAPVVWWTYAAAQALIVWGVIDLIKAEG
ncbi:MAG: lysoplasmalogenase, partial [Hyphomonadaceae bacterium]|nr:lysoplasmalogenase [Hyphomonadaceae bacterium]